MFERNRSAEIVADSFSNTENERLREILVSLVQHLHAFAKDVKLGQGELHAGIDFLTKTGQKCDDKRQEFVLLSDILGLSMLVDSIDNDHGQKATESTVLGPFHMVQSPVRQLGDTIALTEGGERHWLQDRLSAEGDELRGAVVDVWQADANGFYDVQIPEQVPERNLRGLFTCDHNGKFAFRTILPVSYPVPQDGPVGQLLAATARHAHRPAHIHFIVEADGYASVTTHIFVADSPYLDSDAVFGVKESLVLDFAESTDSALAAEYEMRLPFRHAHVEIRLAKAK